MSQRDRPTALGREVAVFMTAALGVLLVVSTFTLVAYRGALAEQTAVERARARALAEQAAAAALTTPRPGPADLARTAPYAEWVALLSAEGEVLVQRGAAPPGDPLAPSGGERPQTAVTAGPSEATAGRVTALVPLPASDGRLIRLDLAPGPLAASGRSLGILTAVVVGADLAVALLVLLYVRRLLRPWGRLVERARELGPTPSDGDDEIRHLLGTFDRAVETLAQRSPDTPLEALQEALGEGGDSGVLVLDGEGKIAAANPAADELLGTRLEAGMAAEQALATQPELANLLLHHLGEDAPTPLAEVEVPRGEQRLRLGVSLFPLAAGEGTPGGVLALLADLTEARRQAATERLAESLAQLGELSAGVAHELRNGLATVSGYVELMERHAESPPQPRHLQALRRECGHLERVVDDFLSFARPGTARLEEVELNELLERLAERKTEADGGVEFQEFADGPALCRGDPVLLERALGNLLENAHQAHVENGHSEPVELRLESDDEGWRITILDRGPGLPEEVRRRLFRPFVTARAEGTGLGLALAWRIVRLHGGSLEIQEREGGGSRVEVGLPGLGRDGESVAIS